MFKQKNAFFNPFGSGFLMKLRIIQVKHYPHSPDIFGAHVLNGKFISMLK